MGALSGGQLFLPSGEMGRVVPFEQPHLPRVDTEGDGLSGQFAGAGEARARTQQFCAIGMPRFDSKIGK